MDTAAIITGAGQGIGREIALVLARKGVKVGVVDVREDTAIEVAREIVREGGSAVPVVADVSQVDAVREAAKNIKGELGTIGILVCNAGILHSTPIEEVTEEEWDRIMAVNLKSAFFCAQAVVPDMKEGKWGRLIFMSSLAGRMGGYVNGLGYSAAKAGMIGLARGFAIRLAPWGITSNAIAPGTTDSEIIRQIPEKRRQQLREMIPIGRLGQPRDIANLAGFLASVEAEFITGAVIDINGGMYMG
jgi:3-oxoacyl-[acyl-carrier protein] reductase